MHWTADHLLLWQSPITRPSLLSAQMYYANTLVHMPPAFHTLHYVVGTSGAAILLSKALGGKESNWLFDGASLCTLPTSAKPKACTHILIASVSLSPSPVRCLCAGSHAKGRAQYVARCGAQNACQPD